jgi:hypothetical protein
MTVWPAQMHNINRKEPRVIRGSNRLRLSPTSLMLRAYNCWLSFAPVCHFLGETVLPRPACDESCPVWEPSAGHPGSLDAGRPVHRN